MDTEMKNHRFAHLQHYRTAKPAPSVFLDRRPELTVRRSAFGSLMVAAGAGVGAVAIVAAILVAVGAI